MVVPIIPIIVSNKDNEAKEELTAAIIIPIVMLLVAFIALFLYLGPSNTTLPIIFILLIVMVTGILFVGLSSQSRERNKNRKLYGRSFYCPSCGTENNPAQYCMECGSKLPM